MLEIVRIAPSRPADQQPPGKELIWCALRIGEQRLCSFEWDATSDLTSLLETAARAYQSESKRKVRQQLNATLGSSGQP